MNIDEFENASQVDENIYPLPSVNEDISQLTSDPIELISSDDIVEKNQEYALMEQWNWLKRSGERWRRVLQRNERRKRRRRRNNL